MKKALAGRRVRDGVTLVEVVISMALILLVFGGAYQLIITSSRLTKLSRDHYVAISIAKNRLERARNFQYADLKDLKEINLVVDANGSPDLKGQYARTTMIQTNYMPNLSKITVTVKLRDRRTGLFSTGTKNQEVMSSLFTEYLVQSP